jgi:hypothetical protein
MSSLLLTDTAALRGRVRGTRGGRRVVVPLAEYRAERAGHPAGAADAPAGYADGAGFAGVWPDAEALEYAEQARRAGYAEPAEEHDAACGTPSGEVPLRLTRRGRIVVRVLAGAALLLVVAVGALAGRPALAGPETSATPVADHVVRPGETLWGIAGEVAPSADRRDTVAQIIKLNGLDSAQVTAGQRLSVPAESR